MLAFSLTCAAMAAAGADAGTQPTSSPPMRAAFEALTDLWSLTEAPRARPGPRDAKTVDEALGALRQLRHALPADAQVGEPAAAALASLFLTYVEDTQRRWQNQEIEAVALRIRTLTNLCFACHSREPVAADFVDSRSRLAKLRLSPLERARLLAATRQFDAALVAYDSVLAQRPAFEAARWEYGRALQEAMAIRVQVKDDAGGALRFLEQIAHQGAAPPPWREALADWSADVLAWQKERFWAASASPEALFRKGRGLVDQALGQGAFAADANRQVLLWRAAGYVNLALATNPKLEMRGEALLLLGRCAEALGSPLLWDVDLLFYEMCIRENPKTSLARRCFQRLSDRLYLGFTGSMGTVLPEEEQVRLKELRQLAQPRR